jgi:hypothetical protein
MISLENANRVRESAVNVHGTIRVSPVPIPPDWRGREVDLAASFQDAFLRQVSTAWYFGTCDIANRPLCI